MGRGQTLLKGGVVSGFLKQRESPDTAVQDMIGEIGAGDEAWRIFSRTLLEAVKKR